MESSLSILLSKQVNIKFTNKYFIAAFKQYSLPQVQHGAKLPRRKTLAVMLGDKSNLKLYSIEGKKRKQK